MRFATQDFTSTISKGLIVEFRRWRGPLPGIPEGDPWPSHCLPIGEDVDPVGGGEFRIHSDRALGNMIPVRSMATIAQFGVKVSRPPVDTPGGKVPIRVKLFVLPPGKEWELFHTFELHSKRELDEFAAAGTPLDAAPDQADIAYDWPEGSGGVALVPEVNEAFDAPGFYAFELSVHGAFLAGYKPQRDGEGINPDDIEEDRREKPMAPKEGPSRKDRRAFERGLLKLKG